MSNFIFNSFFQFLDADFTGEIAALAAAALWAVASVVYGTLGVHIPPLPLNFLKGIVAIALLVLTILIQGEVFPQIPPLPLCLLLLGGVVGIGCGDTAFFGTINCLGARRALLMGTLAPPMAAVLALIFLQEKLSVIAWCGILLTALGVAWVVTERTPDTLHICATHLWRGIYLGVLTAVTNATGTVLSRAAFAMTSLNPLWAALLRLSAGVLFLVVWALFSKPQNHFQLKTLKSLYVVFALFIAAFCGTYLGIWLQQTAIKFSAAGIASTLLQTSPIFVIPIAIWRGEVVTFRAVIGVVMAIAGVALIFL